MNTAASNQVIVSLDARSAGAVIRHGVVLLAFLEPWVDQCHRQLAILERVAQQVGPRAIVATVNVDEARLLAVRFKVEAIPTLVVFNNGEVARTFVGVHSESALIAALESAVGRLNAHGLARS